MKLNKRQKQIFIGALIALVVSFLYPPYHQLYGGRASEFLGFHLIGSKIFGTVHVGLLFGEWFLILIIGAGLIFYFKDE